MINHQEIFDNCVKSAEGLFGKQISGIKIQPVKFDNEQGPVLAHTGENEFTPVFKEDIKNNVNEYTFEAAHEAFHTLSSKNDIPPTILEEGLATYFSEKFAEDTSIKNPAQNYRKAAELVVSLINADPEIIKKVRAIQPIVSKITQKDLLEANDQIDKKLSEEITKPFYQ